MKKKILCAMLAVGMSVSLMGCTTIWDSLRDNRNLQEQEELENEQQAIIDAIEEAADGENKPSEDDNSGADESGNGADDNGADDNTQSGDNTGADNTGAQVEKTYYINLDSDDLYGNAVTTDELIGDAKIVIINYWEPWCGPCVGEIPDLEKLYENYKNQGVVIIGIYTSGDMLDEIQSLVQSNGITYPVIEASEDSYSYMSDYVPTTVFLDGSGCPLEDSQYIGARSYEDWASILEYYIDYME